MAAIAGMSILVTGASQGIGRALVAEALRRGAGHVYAGGAGPPWPDPGGRVTPLSLDPYSPEAIRAAAARIRSLNVLLNSDGTPWEIIQAFLPQLAAARGAIVNSIGVSAMTHGPADPAYLVSRAAAVSLTQALQVLFGGTGVRVQAILSGPADPDPVPDPGIARAIMDGIQNEDDYIIPAPLRVDYVSPR